MKQDKAPASSADRPGSKPPHVLTSPVVYAEDTIRPADLVHFFRRHWRRIAVAGLVAGALSAILTLIFLPREYEASATLVLSPPRVSSELKPQLMSIQGFQRLLESDALIDETISQLLNDGILSENEQQLEIGAGLRTRIYVSRRSEATTLAPVIELTARGASAEKAAAIANTWAEVFLKRSHELQVRSMSASIDLVEAQYKKSADQVMELDDERLEHEESFSTKIGELQVRWRRRIDEAQVRWDRRIMGFENETEDRIAQFQLETRREIESFARNQGLVKGSPIGEADRLAESEAVERVFKPEVERRLLQIMTIRIQLAQTSQFLNLQKAISNDALWQASVLSQIGIMNIQEASQPHLSSQEINMVYTKLAEELSEMEVDLENVVEQDRESIRRLVSGMEEVQRERSAGLLKLHAERTQESEEMKMKKSAELAELSLGQETELKNLERRRGTVLQQVDRRLENARDLLSELASTYNQAEIARGVQDLADVRLAAHAVPPQLPRSRRLIPKTMIGVTLGVLLGTLMAVVRETERT